MEGGAIVGRSMGLGRFNSGVTGAGIDLLRGVPGSKARKAQRGKRSSRPKRVDNPKFPDGAQGADYGWQAGGWGRISGTMRKMRTLLLAAGHDDAFHEISLAENKQYDEGGHNQHRSR